MNLRQDLGPRAQTVATLQRGERLDILETRRRFVRVRTAKGIEGWTDSNLLLSQQQVDALDRLAGRAAKLPSQGAATTYDVLNVHIAPMRQAANFAQIPEGGSVEVLVHRVVPRSSAAPQPENVRVPSDDWFLVRMKDGKAGWVLARQLMMSIPDEVAQYAEGHAITSYLSLGEVPEKDSAEVHHNWLWTTSSSGAQPYDFDSFRVFVWAVRKHRYETAYIERNVVGFYPVELQELPGQTEKAFSLMTEEKDGQRYKKTFAFSGYRIRMVSKVPYQAPEPLPEIPTVADFSPPETPQVTVSWTETIRGWGKKLLRR